MLSNQFVWYRVRAIAVKETLHMFRNPIVLVGMILLPFIEVVLFAALFNFNPHHLSLAVLDADNTVFSKTLIQKLINTNYFDITSSPKTEKEAEHLMSSGKIQFILTIPPNFSRNLIRGNKPNVLLEADMSNPPVISGALNAATTLVTQLSIYDNANPLIQLPAVEPAYNLIVQERYNPDEIPFYFSIPAMLAVAICLALLNFATDSIVMEVQRGSMENLLVTPARPQEVIFAKMIPYLVLGSLQLLIIIYIAHYGFDLPMEGSILLLFLASLPTLIASIALGILFSLITKNEFSAFELGNYYTILSLLFSGIVLPFQGMPFWGQWIGNILPVTHLKNIILGIMLKGNTFSDIWQPLSATILFMLVIIYIVMMQYKYKFE